MDAIVSKEKKHCLLTRRYDDTEVNDECRLRIAEIF